MKTVLTIIMSLFFTSVFAAELSVQNAAPLFLTKTHEGKDFALGTRKGSWTVLYFYPKAATTGCTQQACAFRDQLQKIRNQGADVFGISTDTVEAQAEFHKNEKLNFTLLADPDGKIAESYGAKMPVVKMSKRWTFILDPDLKIRDIQKDVDPALDAERVAKKIAELKSIQK